MKGFEKKNLCGVCRMINETLIQKNSPIFPFELVKFIYSEKATKFCKISTVNLTVANLWPTHNILNLYNSNYSRTVSNFKLYLLPTLF